MNKNLLPKPLRIILSLGLAAVLLWLSFRGIEWEAFMTTIKGCRWPLVIVSALAGGLMPACRALRWRLLALPFDPSIKRSESVTANYFAYLVNMGIPYTHEATRCVIIQRSRHGSGPGYDRLVGLAAAERLCDAACIAILFVVISAVSWNKYGTFLFDGLRSNSLSGVLASGLFVCAIILSLGILYFVSRAKSMKTGKENRIHAFFKGIGEGIKSIASLRHPCLFWWDSLILWLLYWLQFYLATKALPGMETAGPADCLFGVIASMLSTIVPAPGGFGAFHYMTASAMVAACAIPWATGIACATVIHETQALFLIAAGMVSFLSLRGKRQKSTTITDKTCH